MKYSKATVAASASTVVLSTAVLAPSTVLVEGRRTVPKWLREAYNNKDIPLDSGRDWITLPNGVEYQPGPIEDELNDPRMAKLRARSLGYSSSSGANYNEGYKRSAYGKTRSYDGDANAMTTPYIDGSESYYDEFAQAWRALGWYIDCGNTFYSQADEDDDRDDSSGCKRYLLWASVRSRKQRKSMHHLPLRVSSHDSYSSLFLSLACTHLLDRVQPSVRACMRSTLI